MLATNKAKLAMDAGPGAATYLVSDNILVTKLSKNIPSNCLIGRIRVADVALGCPTTFLYSEDVRTKNSTGDSL